MRCRHSIETQPDQARRSQASSARPPIAEPGPNICEMVHIDFIAVRSVLDNVKRNKGLSCKA